VHLAEISDRIFRFQRDLDMVLALLRNLFPMVSGQALA